MTCIAGFLVGDYGPNGIKRVGTTGLKKAIEDYTLIDNFPPYGALLQPNIFPEKEFGSEKIEEFMNKALDLYNEIMRKGFKEVRMAATYLDDALIDYELRDIGRELSPNLFNDWLTVGEIVFENAEKTKSGKNVKGILAVAEIKK